MNLFMNMDYGIRFQKILLQFYEVLILTNTSTFACYIEFIIGLDYVLRVHFQIFFPTHLEDDLIKFYPIFWLRLALINKKKKSVFSTI